jgi:hypothetical protein
MLSRHAPRPSWSWVLVLVAAAGGLFLWPGLAAPRVAYAQIPDSGAQLNEMIKELRVSNQKLTDIAAVLREIRDAQPKKDKDKDKDRPPPPKP